MHLKLGTKFIFEGGQLKAFLWHSIIFKVKRIPSKMFHMLSLLMSVSYSKANLFIIRTEYTVEELVWRLTGEQNDDDTVWKQGKIQYSDRDEVKVCNIK